MIYNSLEILPYKTFFKIVDSQDVSLLKNGAEAEEKDLKELWESLLKEYNEISPEKEEMNLLRVKRDIEAIECKYKAIQVSLSALDFHYDDDLIEILQSYGYKLTKENYYEDLKRISRESEALLMKSANIKKKLPKVDANSASTKVTIDRLFAFYSSVLGFDFDYNTISVTKVLALKEQVNSKIKSQENNTKK